MDWTQHVQPITAAEFNRYQGTPLVNTPGGDITVRAWNYMPNVPEHGGEGIVETVNVLSKDKTAMIVVHPWGIEDGQGWKGPQAYNAYGYVFEGRPSDNFLYLQHVDDNLKPFVDSMRSQLALVGYSLPGTADATRRKLYRDYTHQPREAERVEGQAEIEAYLSGLTGSPWPSKIPVVLNLEHDAEDYVFYDNLGYATDMCFATTTAGYVPLSQDFNVFLVGDATLAANWQTLTAATWSMGDFNGDGAVNDKDATLLAANWQATSAAAVPEPATIVLLASILPFAWTALSMRRKRK